MQFPKIAIGYPAYDLCFAYRPGSPWVSSQSLTVNVKRTNITTADLLTVAKTVTIKKAAAIMEEVKQPWVIGLIMLRRQMWMKGFYRGLRRSWSGFRVWLVDCG